MYYERKKSNCNILFMSALTNYVGTEVGILNNFTIHALVPDDWMGVFFRAMHYSLCAAAPPPPPPPQTKSGRETSVSCRC